MFVAKNLSEYVLCLEIGGWEAYSCDVEPCSGGHPEWHICQDVIPLINGNCEFDTADGAHHVIDGKWDLLICHPPCTYLSNAGARHLYKNHVLNKERYTKGLEAKEFFMKFLNADCDHIVVENPIPSKVYELPPYTQTIQPYEFGHEFKKKTCLWEKNVPMLISTNIVEVRESTKVAGNWFNKGGKDRQKNRAKTFEGIAQAMAEQWGSYIENE